MAQPTAGTYLIMHIGGNMALDVKGASDESGTNVQQYSINYSDAQIWALMKPEGESGGWQVTCSLTGKCLDVQGGSAKSGANVQQYNDNNSRAQRWQISTDGKTYTYNGKSYPTYKFHPYTNTKLSLDVYGNGKTSGVNIQVWSNNSTDAQRWVLIPVSCMTSAGTYELVLAADTSMCAEVASSSTANSANIQVGSRSDSNNQIWRADVDSQTYLVKLTNANSGKLIDIKGAGTTNGTDIIQYTANGTAAQNWLPVQSGSVKIESSNVPTYEMAAQVGSGMRMDCKGGGKTAKTNIQLYTDNNSLAQRFAFVKSEMIANALTAPGALSRTSFKRDGVGSITVSGLTFASKFSTFQARYMVRTYGTKKNTYTDSGWTNLVNGSTVRSGWGDAWTATFAKAPVNGQVTLPFNKTYALSAAHPWIDIFIEVRVFSANYNGFKAHGPTTRTVVSLGINPSLSVTSLALNKDAANDSIKFDAKLSMIAGGDLQYLRGQLIGQDGSLISDMATSANLALTFPLSDGTLYRLPKNGEKITFRWSLISTYNANAKGDYTITFNYANSLVFTPTLGYSTNDSDTGIVTSPYHATDYCFVEVEDIERSKLIKCLPTSGSNTTNRKWRVVPPLNKDVKIIIIGSSAAAGGNWTYKELDCRINSHKFIWNWTRYGSTDYDAEFATVMVNTDNPPQQTRQFTTDLQLITPAGRTHPVGFASRAIGIDLSVEGVVIDPDANYYAPQPLPNHSDIPAIKQLVRLSANGIHPIYRTPYGDWYWVGIESVDISKTELQKSTVTVTQHAVED